MKTFVINLDHATDRWATIEPQVRQVGLDIQRVSAVLGKELAEPYPDYCEQAYQRLHGRQTNNREIGCYLSHLKAMEMFLDTGDAYGIILEDDVELHPELALLVELAIEADPTWGLLRLSGLHGGTPVTVRKINDDFHLAVNLTQQAGSGAYVVNRDAAEKLCSGLRPMEVPYDHAFDREWRYGFKAVTMLPLPVTQNELYDSSIILTKKFGPKRYLTVFPYRAANESRRILHRSMQYFSTKTGHRKAA